MIFRTWFCETTKWVAGLNGRLYLNLEQLRKIEVRSLDHSLSVNETPMRDTVKNKKHWFNAIVVGSYWWCLGLQNVWYRGCQTTEPLATLEHYFYIIDELYESGIEPDKRWIKLCSDWRFSRLLDTIDVLMSGRTFAPRMKRIWLLVDLLVNYVALLYRFGQHGSYFSGLLFGEH